MLANQEYELENELESELEAEFENESGFGELEYEAGLGEFEAETGFGESEFETGLGEFEAEAGMGEHEQGEQFLGNVLSGLFGEGENELGELEFEYEQGEQFGIFRRIARLAKKAAPMLKSVARIAAPIAGKAVGGLFGGPAGAMLGSKLATLAAQQIREMEMGGMHELESHEFELGEHELGEHEMAHELAEHEAHAEAMAHYASFAESEHEAEALIGAATMVVLSPRDRRALRALVPNLVRGAAILTRILRMRRATRAFVPVVPEIMRRTVRTLKRGAATGRPVTRKLAGAVMANQTRRVLSSPKYCAAVLRRNVRATKAVGRQRSVVAPVRRRSSI
jgi:hypothetical protein